MTYIKPKTKIYFHFLIPGVPLSYRNRLKGFISNIFKNEKTRITEINYIFCSNSYLRKLNKKYLSHNFNTDILTFPLSNENGYLVADIYIGVDQVRKNARRFGFSFKEEVHRVIFHGTLHLCGYEDKSQSEEALMRENEDKYLEIYFSRYST
jgi:probable rRNA maturation factor